MSLALEVEIISLTCTLLKELSYMLIQNWVGIRDVEHKASSSLATIKP